MKLFTWQQKGSFFHFRGHAIFTIDEGAGEPLLLLHGFPTACWDYHRMWPSLLKHYRLLTLDFIGFGFSDKPKNYAYSISDQADLIEAFLLSKGVKQVHLISHDYGDTVAQELLARQLDQASTSTIQSLCLLNGGLFPETHKPLLIQKLLMSPIGGLIGKMLNRKKLGKNLKRIFGPMTQPSEGDLDDFWTLIQHQNGVAVSHKLIRYMQERVQYRARWVGALQKTSVPIRLIDGIYDPISGKHMVDRYRALIPNPDLIELPGIGHFPLLEAPNLVLKNYSDFRVKVHTAN